MSTCSGGWGVGAQLQILVAAIMPLSSTQLSCAEALMGLKWHRADGAQLHAVKQRLLDAGLGLQHMPLSGLMPCRSEDGCGCDHSTECLVWHRVGGTQLHAGQRRLLDAGIGLQ